MHNVDTWPMTMILYSGFVAFFLSLSFSDHLDPKKHTHTLAHMPIQRQAGRQTDISKLMYAHNSSEHNVFTVFRFAHHQLKNIGCLCDFVSTDRHRLCVSLVLPFDFVFQTLKIQFCQRKSARTRARAKESEFVDAADIQK